MSDQPQAVEPSTPTFDKELPFAFAEQHGVFLSKGEVYTNGDVSTAVLLELQRFLGSEFTINSLEEINFKRQLTQKYQTGDGAAQRAAEQLDADMDLGQIVDDLEQQTDLLAGDDRLPSKALSTLWRAPTALFW